MDENVADIVKIVGLKVSNMAYLGHRGAPPLPPPSRPFCARLARSTSSANGFQQQQNWQALEFVSQEMKGDRELCMPAVAQHGLPLQWVSEEMKGDRELCTAAVAYSGVHGHAIEFMSDEMKGDEEIVLAAVRRQVKECPLDKGDLEELKWYALKYVPEHMLQNSRVRGAAGI